VPQFKVKQLAGGTAAAVGATGTVLSVFAVINVWSVAHQFRDSADGTLVSQGKIDATQGERLRGVLTRVDSELNDLEFETPGFSEWIGTMEADLSDLQSSTPQRINRAAMLATVFFIDFGGSQISLLLHGFHLAWRNEHVQLATPGTTEKFSRVLDCGDTWKPV